MPIIYLFFPLFHFFLLQIFYFTFTFFYNLFIYLFFFLLCSLVRISTKKFPNYTMSNQSYVLILEVIMAINFFGISECKKNK